MSKGYVLDRELKDAVQQWVKQLGSSFQPRPLKGRRERGIRRPEGGSTTNATKFAIVTQSAGASSYSSSGITGGTVGQAVLLDGDMQKETSAPIQFKSVHFVAIAVNAIIVLHSVDRIEPGDTWPDKKVWGEIFSSPHELYQLTGAAAKKVLYLPDGTSGPQSMRWAGGECQSQ